MEKKHKKWKYLKLTIRIIIGIPLLIYGLLIALTLLALSTDNDYDTISGISLACAGLSVMGFVICSTICIVKYNKKIMISAIGLLFGIIAIFAPRKITPYSSSKRILQRNFRLIAMKFRF